MSEIFLAPSIICAFFFAYWVVAYPSILMEFLFFRGSGLSNRALSVATWVYLFGFVYFIIYLTGLLRASHG